MNLVPDLARVAGVRLLESWILTGTRLFRRSPRPVLSGWVACFAFRGSVFIGRLLLGETMMRPLTSEGQR